MRLRPGVLATRLAPSRLRNLWLPPLYSLRIRYVQDSPAVCCSRRDRLCHQPPQLIPPAALIAARRPRSPCTARQSAPVVSTARARNLPAGRVQPGPPPRRTSQRHSKIARLHLSCTPYCITGSPCNLLMPRRSHWLLGNLGAPAPRRQPIAAIAAASSARGRSATSGKAGRPHQSKV